jgi:sugar-specific transcriptional regulator TrmB
VQRHALGGQSVVQEGEEILKLLGLSSAQAHVYLTLIRSGKTSAKALAERTGIACPDIYRIMNIFKKKGLIQETIELPKKFEAIKIEQSLPFLMSDKIEEIKKLESGIKFFVNTMKREQKQEATITSSDLILLPATKIALQKRKEKIRKARNTIDTIISWKCHKAYLNQNMKLLTKKAIDRGVKYRFIIENPQKINLALKSETFDILIKNGAKIKYTTKNPPALVSIYDNKEALIYTANNQGLCDTPLIWTNNHSMVSIAKGYFEHLWATAETQQNST